MMARFLALAAAFALIAVWLWRRDRPVKARADWMGQPYLVGGVTWRDGQPVFGTGSPWSVTSRSDNGTALFV